MRHISVNEKFLKRINKASRQAFTLVELMIVIAIIAVLLGLLTPSLMSVFGVARESQVQTEIRSLEQGIAAFKAQFGVNPPSSITLFEKPSQTLAADRATLRSIWTRFDFTDGYTYDWNGNGTKGESNTSVTLRGAECLVFFLGGMRAYDSSTSTLLNAMSGFSRNPASPFAVQGVGELRDGPFFDFKSSRLVASNNYSNFLVYIDPLPGHAAPYAPYFYASANEGRGYVASDLTNGTGSTLTNAYYISTTNYLNPRTFQIISPGADHLFGSGGLYTESAVNTNCNLTNKADYDNLTNFHAGRLKP